MNMPKKSVISEIAMNLEQMAPASPAQSDLISQTSKGLRAAADTIEKTSRRLIASMAGADADRLLNDFEYVKTILLSGDRKILMAAIIVLFGHWRPDDIPEETLLALAETDPEPVIRKYALFCLARRETTQHKQSICKSLAQMVYDRSESDSFRRLAYSLLLEANKLANVNSVPRIDQDLDSAIDWRIVSSFI